MALFEDEKLLDGITLRIYRFDTDMPRLSIMVRMKGEKTDKATCVVNARKELKEEKKRAVELHKLQHKPKWFNKLPFLHFSSAQDMKDAAELQKLVNFANGDPFFDLPRMKGEHVVEDLKNKLKEAGLTVTTADRRSNGDLDEEILLFV